MNGDAISRLQPAEIAQQRRKFIHAHIEFAIGHRYRRIAFRLRNKNQCRFVFILGKMAIHAVVRSIELPAHEPLPEWRIIGIERRMPILVPTQQVGVFPEAFRKFILAESVEDVRDRSDSPVR